MNSKIKSIRPFVGAKNYTTSRNFYADLGFTEHSISATLSYFEYQGFGFYLQDYYLQDWIDNTMVFMEVDSVENFYSYLLELDLTTKYPESRIVPIRTEYWGKECFVHDPSGILWHFGAFI